MSRKTIRYSVVLALLLFFAACSRLSTLTPDLLSQSETKWNASKPANYQLTVEMKGDRVDKEQFEVSVVAGRMAALKRNGRDVPQTGSQDYSMDGLFRMLHQEMALAERPVLLGAPEGYTAYLMAKFDDQTGRLIEYRRTVGGTSNTINIRVLDLHP